MLEQLYWKEGLSEPQMAKKLGVCHSTIARVMIRLGIPRRNASEQKLGFRNSFYGKKHSEQTRKHLSSIRSKPLPITNDELIKLYTKDGISCEELGKKLGVGHKRIKKELIQLGIKPRPVGYWYQYIDNYSGPIGTKGDLNPLRSINARKKLSCTKKGWAMPEHVWGQRYARPLYLSHQAHIEEEIKNLQQQGFRCISLVDIIPDVIAIKDNKVYAVEIEFHHPNYGKYVNCMDYDDIFWVIHKKGGCK